MLLCVGSFLPFQTTYYLNGHHIIERELQRHGVRFRKDDNAFLWTADLAALQAAADRLDPDDDSAAAGVLDPGARPEVFEEGPGGDQPAARTTRFNQVEYCRNLIFRRHFPIHKIFERSCESACSA